MTKKLENKSCEGAAADNGTMIRHNKQKQATSHTPSTVDRQANQNQE